MLIAEDESEHTKVKEAQVETKSDKTGCDIEGAAPVSVDIIMGCGASSQQRDSIALPCSDIPQASHAAAENTDRHPEISEPEVITKPITSVGQDADTSNFHEKLFSDSSVVDKMTRVGGNVADLKGTAEEANINQNDEDGKLIREKKLNEEIQSETISANIDERISKLYFEIEGENGVVTWETLQFHAPLLSNTLLALGIGQHIHTFIDDSFQEFKPNIRVPPQAFKTKFKDEWETCRRLSWLAQTDMLRCIAKSLAPATDESDPLSGLRDLTDDEILELSKNMHKSIAECLLRNLKNTPRAHTAALKDRDNNVKFCADPNLFTMKYGGLEDFEMGVRELVGAPHPQVWDEINKEHRQRGDSHIMFRPGNYDTETTSYNEFMVVIDPNMGNLVSKDKRRVKSLDTLRKEPMAIKAKLWKEELLGLSLYTGPMFYKYNAVLRKFPQKAYETCKIKQEPCTCKQDGKKPDGPCSCYNTYPTTINAILSGLRKLMWVAPLPKDRFVYRGLSGMNLPDQFFKPDEYGIRGGTEFGMMSTTTDINVAIHYSENGKQMPTVFKIGVGAINRGASLEFCSQYAGEKEILFPPLSYLELVGEISYTTTELGTVIRMVPLQIVANLNSPGLEELIGMRKKLHIDSFDHQHHNLKRELLDLMKVADSECYFKVQDKDSEQEDIICEVDSQFSEVVEKHKRRPAKWYNDDGRYRSAVIEMLNMKENAIAVPKLRLSMVIYEEWKNKQRFLRQANRMVTKDRARALRAVGNDNDQKKIAAFELCKKNGIVAEQLEERNEMSETPLIRESADGDPRAVLWLLEAGADVHARMENEMGFTAINQAAYFGHAACIMHLLKYKADPCVVDRSGGTPLVAAALNDELECLQVLLQAGADRTFDERILQSRKSKNFFKELSDKVEKLGQSPGDPDLEEEIKSDRKQRDRLLNGEKVKGFEAEEEMNESQMDSSKANRHLEKVKYINKATFPNQSTPLMKAAVNGHVSCVRVLILAGADTELENIEGKTAKKLVVEKIQAMKKSKQTTGVSDEMTLSSFKLGHAVNQHNDLLERLEKCKKALEMSPEQIRMEDSAEVMSFDASRKESHLKTFENQALSLKQELERLIENSKDSWCDHKRSRDKKDKVVDNVVKQFKALLEKHRTRTPRWYNDGGKYRSAVSEMLSMKENAMAIPKLSAAMFEEWEDKQNFLRQANRMVSRESLRALRDNPEGSEERRSAALELCKSAGMVIELLEERNEMSETPLIREAADGNARNLHLLLEAGADVTAKQDHQIGFSAMNQAAYFGHAPCLRHLLAFKADANIMDGYGGTPLVAAALNGEEECVQVLVESGANVNQSTSNGNTPLMKAALNGHSKCVRILIVAGADVRLKNKDGHDALSLAKGKMGPLIEELVEFQEEYFVPETHAVTYDDLKEQGYNSYIWDADIGQSGGFRYTTTDGKERADPIDENDIGEIKEIKDLECTYYDKTNISGLSKVTVKKCPSVPSGTPYGWDHDANCWTYFTDASSDMPTHFAKYMNQEVRKSQSTMLVKRKQRHQIISSAEKLFMERKRASLRKQLQNYKDCVEALGKSVEDIREEDWASVKEKDSTRKDSHMKTFEMQALALKRELEVFIKVSTSEFCCVVNDQEKQDVLDQVVREFKVVKQKHQERSPKWYNDDGRYKSGVIEMLSMKDNAMAVPRLTMTMYQEWRSKQSFLRQADRMVSRERFRAIREAEMWSEERKKIALEACKAVGAVMEHLEERNEMSETPLIREAADGNAKNVLLLLEAGSDVDAQQMNNIGFTALNQAAYFGHPQCIAHLLKFRAEVDSLDSYGGTPLVAAALNGEVECVQALLDARADINHATNNLNTPLMKAALNGNVVCVRVLLGRGAIASRTNKDGKNALVLAMESRVREENRLLALDKKEEGRDIAGSIEERRKQETIKRLKKLIQDHDKVILDLKRSTEEIRKNYADLFQDITGAIQGYGK